MARVRPATLQDADAVAELWKSLVQEDPAPEGERWAARSDSAELWSRHVFDLARAGEGALFVAEDEENIVGFIAIETRSPSPLFKARSIGRIDSVYVKRGNQGRGVGRALVGAGEAWLALQGIETIEVKTFFGNVASRALWTRLGYEPIVLTLEKRVSQASEAARKAAATSPESRPAFRSAPR